MFVYSRRRIAAPIAATALASGVILAGIPASAAPATTTFGTSCLATPSAVAGPTTQSQSGSVIVDAPESVGAGETFEVTIQPGPIAFPGSASGATVQNVSRIKVDVDVPANATLVEATIVPGTSA
ncbi:Ig-like domain repeat protein, partial [Rhodococcus erythropolis]|nr:Ig-like domain repeat protein [Rhodococcus erythropolis]